MNKTTEALKLAELVEASAEEYMGEDGMVMVIPLDLYNDLIGALAAIREVLAEPVKQEPVAWWELNEDIGARLRCHVCGTSNEFVKPAWIGFGRGKNYD